MITAVILARNEENNILDCIQKIRPHVAEILLIDMESTDKTVELARPHVAKILPHPRIPNFDVARNIAIPEAKYDWLWFVDADERIPDILGRVVQEVIRRDGKQFEAIVLPFKSYFAGKWIEHCGWWPGYTMPRVLKRGYFRFKEELHSGVEVRGRQIMLPADPERSVEHFSYRSVEHYIEKFNQYTSTEAMNLARRGTSYDWEQAVRDMIGDLWSYYEGRHGKQDGFHGWILSWLAGQYRWMTHAKLLDQTKTAEVARIPEDLDAVLSVMRDELGRRRKLTPKLPLGILWRSPLRDASGYATDSRTAVRALALGRSPLSVEETSWATDGCALPHDQLALLETLRKAAAPVPRIAITTSIPTLARPDSTATINVLRTTFETDRLPASWHAAMEAFDEIWVWSEANRRAFRRGWVPPEKIRVIPGFVDTERFCPTGKRLALPEALRDRFIFLAVMDWHLRKGWDILLRAYCAEFEAGEGLGLLLKITTNHVPGLDAAMRQADDSLKTLGTSLKQRPDIVFWNKPLAEKKMAALYRAAHAFVVPSRSEGWGRPYLEAMASGLPTIGTAASGNIDFMDTSNSFLIPARPAPVSEAAGREIPVFVGHQWFEPDERELAKTMRNVVRSRRRRTTVAALGLATVLKNFGLDACRRAWEAAIDSAESMLVPPTLPRPREDAIRVDVEGELFAGHSFSKINEVIGHAFANDPNLAVAFHRAYHNPTYPARQLHERLVELLVDRRFDRPADVVIRHAYPPNWTPPAAGRWVHIQPWEFGALPIAWVEPLRKYVDEVWAPSHYVRQVYERSGFPADHIHVIPWGVDPMLYRPNAPDLVLPTRKSFRFLFFGGTILRKGIDRVLAAYLAEFTPADDVCLVIKDQGTQSFYRNQNAQHSIEAARQDPKNPEICYLDSQLTEGQLPSLFTACQCLVAPYRGEGFGLPILEGMACGVPAIVPRGGPTDDFVTPKTGYFLKSKTIECERNWRTRRQPTELSIDIGELRSVMRAAYVKRAATREKGRRASEAVLGGYTWPRTVQMMTERIQALARLKTPRRADQAANSGVSLSLSLHQQRPVRLSLCMIARNNETTIEVAIRSIKPYVDEIIVVDTGSTDKTPEICRGIGAKVYYFPWCDDFAAARNESLNHGTGDWIFWMDSDDSIDEANGKALRRLVDGQHKPNVLAYIVQVLCPGRSDDDGVEATIVDHVKLFRNRPDLRFEMRIHEQILASIRAAGGEIGWTDLFVVHSGSDQTLEGRRRKWARDIRILGLELKDRPNHSFVLFNFGMTYADVGDHERAIDYLRQSLVNGDPKESHIRKAYALLVNSYSHAERLDDAWETCQKGREFFPKDTELLFHEGMLHHRLGRLREAESSYLSILNTEEERHFTSIDRGLRGFKTRHNLARVYEEMGRVDDALEQWNLAVSDAPGYRMGWRGLIELLLRHGRWDAARGEAQRLIEEKAKTNGHLRSMGHLLLGQIEESADNADGAREQYRLALEQFADDAEVENTWCRFLCERGDYSEAIPALERLCEKYPDDPAALFNLGLANLRQEQFGHAAEWLRASLALRPDHAPTYLHLSEALVRLNRHEEALAVVDQAQQLFPFDGSIAARTDSLRHSAMG